MKYLVAGAAIIILIAVLSGVNLALENLWLGQLETLLEQSRQNAASGDTEAALKNVSDAILLWDNRQGYLSMVLVHDDVDELSRSMGLAADCLARQSQYAPDAITETLELVKTILDGEQLTLRNVF